MRRTVIAVVAVLVAFGFGMAQDAVDLKPTPEKDGFVHEPSQSKFLIPKGWEVVPPQQQGKTAFMGVRDREKRIEVTLSWSPLTVPMDGPDGAIDQQIKQLANKYGQEKVGKPDNITVNERPGVKIPVDNGPTLDEKEAGVVYVFEQVVDEKTRWKVKARATFPKVGKDDSMKLLDDVVKNFKW